MLKMVVVLGGVKISGIEKVHGCHFTLQRFKESHRLILCNSKKEESKMLRHIAPTSDLRQFASCVEALS